MKISDIVYIIEQGENSAVEFKSADVKPDSIAKEMIAFANMSGGVILIGVDDNGLISGTEKDRKWEEWIMNIVRNKIIPPIVVDYVTLEINHKHIVCISVPKGKNKPYQTTDGKYYIRVGSTNRIASISELMRLFQESGVFHFDATSVARTSANSLNFNLVVEYFKNFDIDFENEPETERNKLLINSDILSENGEVTVAGLLVFGIQPARYLLQSGITFVHYAGDDITCEVIDSKHIEGSIDFIVNTTFASIKHNILTPSKIIGLKRMDTTVNYPDKVYRELITNCVAHRSYAIEGSKIRIFMFTNRIEFISPGKLPNTITVEKLHAGVSYRRNPLLAKFMVSLRLMDTFGSGIPNVIAEVKRQNKTIQFEEIGEEFKVTLQI